MEKKEFRLNRILSGTLTPLLLRTPLTPNQVTLSVLGFGVAAGFFFSQGNYLAAVWGAACYQLAAVLDNCDGEIARAKNKQSKIGGWLDIAADALVDIFIFSGIAMGILKNDPEKPAFLFLGLCVSGVFIHLLLVILEKLKGFGPAVFENPNPDAHQRQSVAFLVFDALREGDASWLVVAFALAGKTEWLLWLGAFYMQAIWISAAIFNFKWLFAPKVQR